MMVSSIDVDLSYTLLISISKKNPVAKIKQSISTNKQKHFIVAALLHLQWIV